MFYTLPGLGDPQPSLPCSGVLAVAPIPGNPQHAREHRQSASANPLVPPPADLIRVGSRRWFLQTGVAGLAGVTLADSLRSQALAATADSSPSKKAVILFWLSGGPSHI